jgi:hypothetical protein
MSLTTTTTAPPDSQGDDFSQPRVVEPKDLICKAKLVGLAASRAGPTGAVAFAVKNYDQKTNKSNIDIHVNYVDGLRTVQYTRSAFGTSCVSPALHINEGGHSGDGVVDQLLFLKKGQLHTLPLAGGETVQVLFRSVLIVSCFYDVMVTHKLILQVSEFPLDIESFKLFKKGDESLHVALVMNVYADKTPAETAEVTTEII